MELNIEQQQSWGNGFMKIVVAGIGYVGVVSAASLARDGHQVVAVDVNPGKVDDLRRGKAPIVEPGLAELIDQAINDGSLTASEDLPSAVKDSDITFVCVGTPSRPNGDLDTSYVAQVTREIGEALRHSQRPHTVAYRSTLLPGTTEDLLIPLLEAHAGRRVGEGIGVCVNPEFLREGSALEDYANPAKTVVGGAEDEARPIAQLYAHLDAPTFVVPIKHAEIAKYIDNSWHALKVAFANEIGSLCAALDLDGHAVMEPFLVDQRLNISTAYLKPGFAFGGSCLPKDLRAVNYRARSLDLDLPLMRSILASNGAHLDRVKALIASDPPRKVGLLGLSFKSGTDDLRESPAVALVEWLIGKGHEVFVFDESLSMSALTGSNLREVMSRIPHVAELLQPTPASVIKQADLVVVSSLAGLTGADAEALLAEAEVIDLVHLQSNGISLPPARGICW